MNAWTAQEEKDAALLMTLAREGHVGAFDALVRMFGSWMIASTYKVLGNHEDAEDAAQEAWVYVWRDLSRPHPSTIDSVPGLLWHYGQNAAKNVFSRRNAKKRGGRTPSMWDYDLLRELHGL